MAKPLNIQLVIQVDIAQVACITLENVCPDEKVALIIQKVLRKLGHPP